MTLNQAYSLNAISSFFGLSKVFSISWEGGLGNDLLGSLPLGLLAPIDPICVKRGNTSYIRIKFKQSKNHGNKNLSNPDTNGLFAAIFFE